MRHWLSLVLVATLTASPPALAKLPPPLRRNLDAVMQKQSAGDLAGAVALAERELARTDVPASYRRTMAREAKSAAEQQFDGSGDTAALCKALDLTRLYRDTLMDSELDREDIPKELTRLQARADAASAPCAEPASPENADTEPTPKAPPDPPRATPPRVDRPAPAPASPAPHRTWTPRVQAGTALLGTGAALLVPMGVLLGVRATREARSAALVTDVKQEARPFTEAELATLTDSDRHYRTTTIAAGLCGALGAALLVTGAGLLTVGARGPRVALTPAGGAGFAGLDLRGHF